MGDKIKRILAFIIDWNLCLSPFWAIIFLLFPLVQTNTAMIVVYIILYFTMILSAFAVFVFRDVIFKGRSIGKRLFRLHIFDKTTRKEATTGKKILKNLFFFIYPIDGIVLLASGSSIGNFVTNTEVISEKTIARICNTEYRPSSKLKITLSVIGIIVFVTGTIALSTFSMFSSVQNTLNMHKDTDEYKMAYSYLIASEPFLSLGCDESDVRLTGYSTIRHATPTSEGATETTKMTFKVENSTFSVISHKKNGEWIICKDCTHF